MNSHQYLKACCLRYLFSLNLLVCPDMVVHRNADRERNRVKSLRTAFQTLQSCIPSVPPDTKLSKLDILILATNYIAQLSAVLENDNPSYSNSSSVSLKPDSPLMSLWSMRSHRYLKFYHPIKKWPMRRRLYGNFESTEMDTEIFPNPTNQEHN